MRTEKGGTGECRKRGGKEGGDEAQGMKRSRTM